MTIGAIIAILVLVLCVVLAVVGSPVPLIALGLIGALALAVLLGGVALPFVRA